MNSIYNFCKICLTTEVFKCLKRIKLRLYATICVLFATIISVSGNMLQDIKLKLNETKITDTLNDWLEMNNKSFSTKEKRNSSIEEYSFLESEAEMNVLNLDSTSLTLFIEDLINKDVNISDNKTIIDVGNKSLNINKSNLESQVTKNEVQLNQIKKSSYNFYDTPGQFSGIFINKNVCRWVYDRFVKFGVSHLPGHVSMGDLLKTGVNLIPPVFVAQFTYYGAKITNTLISFLNLGGPYGKIIKLALVLFASCVLVLLGFIVKAGMHYKGIKFGLICYGWFKFKPAAAYVNE